jgi:hypothetical protein
MEGKADPFLGPLASSAATSYSLMSGWGCEEGPSFKCIL